MTSRGLLLLVLAAPVLCFGGYGLVILLQALSVANQLSWR